MEQFAGKTFLIVDDEELLREYFVEEFTDLGAKTLSAANSKDALELVRTEKVDVILSDIRMPGGDGVSLLKHVKEQNAEKPLVFLITGFSDIEPEEAVSLGAETVFKKPFDFNLIASKIADHLDE
jgi:CheY-like chemotaxis protein